MKTIKVKEYKKTCYGFPTTYEFLDNKGIWYFFRLRHGYARIEELCTGKLILEGYMPSFDGVCGWGDIQEWAEKEGLKIQK